MIAALRADRRGFFADFLLRANNFFTFTPSSERCSLGFQIFTIKVEENEKLFQGHLFVFLMTPASSCTSIGRGTKRGGAMWAMPSFTTENPLERPKIITQPGFEPKTMETSHTAGNAARWLGHRLPWRVRLRLPSHLLLRRLMAPEHNLVGEHGPWKERN